MYWYFKYMNESHMDYIEIIVCQYALDKII